MAELSAFEIAEMTKSLTDSQRMIFNQQYSSDKKDRGTTVILALFIAFHCVINVFIMLHQKNAHLLRTNCRRLRYVCNEQDRT